MFKRSGIFVFGVKIAFALATIFISTAANTANPAEKFAGILFGSRNRFLASLGRQGSWYL